MDSIQLLRNRFTALFAQHTDSTADLTRYGSTEAAMSSTNNSLEAVIERNVNIRDDIAAAIERNVNTNSANTAASTPWRQKHSRDEYKQLTTHMSRGGRPEKKRRMTHESRLAIPVEHVPCTDEHKSRFIVRRTRSVAFLEYEITAERAFYVTNIFIPYSLGGGTVLEQLMQTAIKYMRTCAFTPLKTSDEVCLKYITDHPEYLELCDNYVRNVVSLRLPSDSDLVRQDEEKHPDADIDEGGYVSDYKSDTEEVPVVIPGTPNAIEEKKAVTPKHLVDFLNIDEDGLLRYKAAQYDKLINTLSDIVECCICHEHEESERPTPTGKLISLNSCGHVYHEKCWTRARDSQIFNSGNHTCSICRKTVSNWITVNSVQSVSNTIVEHTSKSYAALLQNVYAGDEDSYNEAIKLVKRESQWTGLFQFFRMCSTKGVNRHLEMYIVCTIVQLQYELNMTTRVIDMDFDSRTSWHYSELSEIMCKLPRVYQNTDDGCLPAWIQSLVLSVELCIKSIDHIFRESNPDRRSLLIDTHEDLDGLLVLFVDIIVFFQNLENKPVDVITDALRRGSSVIRKLAYTGQAFCILQVLKSATFKSIRITDKWISTAVDRCLVAEYNNPSLLKAVCNHFLENEQYTLAHAYSCKMTHGECTHKNTQIRIYCDKNSPLFNPKKYVCNIFDVMVVDFRATKLVIDCLADMSIDVDCDRCIACMSDPNISDKLQTVAEECNGDTQKTYKLQREILRKYLITLAAEEYSESNNLRNTDEYVRELREVSDLCISIGDIRQSSTLLEQFINRMISKGYQKMTTEEEGLYKQFILELSKRQYYGLGYDKPSIDGAMELYMTANKIKEGNGKRTTAWPVKDFMLWASLQPEQCTPLGEYLKQSTTVVPISSTDNQAEINGKQEAEPAAVPMSD